MIITNKATAIMKIQQQISKIDLLARCNKKSKEFQRWQKETDRTLANIFGSDSHQLKNFTSIKYQLSVNFLTASDMAIDAQCFQDGLKNAKTILEGFITEIKEYWYDDLKANVDTNIHIDEVLELKPNICGLGFNLNKLFEWFRNK